MTPPTPPGSATTGDTCSTSTASRSSTWATRPGNSSTGSNRDEAELYLQDRRRQAVHRHPGGRPGRVRRAWSSPTPTGTCRWSTTTRRGRSRRTSSTSTGSWTGPSELGLVVGMLPTWGDKWNKKWGQGPEIFTPENARVYGEFLGRRYKDKPIVWILGGDRPVENDRHRAILRAMAEGLRAGRRRPAPDHVPPQRRQTLGRLASTTSAGSTSTCCQTGHGLQPRELQPDRRRLRPQAGQALPRRRAGLRGPPGRVQDRRTATSTTTTSASSPTGPSSPGPAGTPTAATTSGSSFRRAARRSPSRGRPGARRWTCPGRADEVHADLDRIAPHALAGCPTRP